MPKQESWGLYFVQVLFLFVLMLPLAKNFYAVVGPWGLAVWILTLISLAAIVVYIDSRSSKPRSKRFPRGHPWRL